MNGKFFDERRHYEAKDRADRSTRFWGSAHSRDRRFAALLRHVPIREREILDIGCGTGEFLHCAAAAGEQPASYVGIDITPTFIDEAASTPPPDGVAVRFLVADACADPWPVPAADWVVANGLFGHSQPEGAWAARFRLVTERMWAHARQGIAFTLISINSPHRNPEAHYCRASEILAEVEDRFSARCLLDHTYLPNDFLVVVKREERDVGR